MSRPGFQLPAKKEGGQWSWNQQRFKELATQMKDGDYVLSLEKFQKRGSQKQRAYYHAVIVEMLAEFWGCEHDDAHELIKAHCNKKVVEVVNKTTGEVEEQTIGATTAGMTAEQWNHFIERCQRWAVTEFGVVIPEADPEWMFKEKSA